MTTARTRWDRRQARRRRFTQYRYVVTSGVIVGGFIGWTVGRLL